MRYQHRFRVHAPLQVVADFHSRSASMAAITPPPIVVRVHHAPEIQRDGDEMDFTMWIGPLPVRWVAHIENVSPAGFIDRQLRGPFKQWTHSHSFVSIDTHTTDVLDEVSVELRAHPLWGAVGLAMLFAFRAWKTRQILESTARS